MVGGVHVPYSHLYKPDQVGTIETPNWLTSYLAAVSLKISAINDRSLKLKF